MKSFLRAAVAIPLAAAVLLLASCSIGLPPNIPRASGTPGVNGTPGSLQLTGTPPAGGYPVITATAAPGVPPVITATSAGGAGTSPTAVPAATATLAGGSGTAATAAPTISDSGGAGMSTGGINLNGITLPAQRTPIQFPSGAASYVVTTNLQNGTPQAYQVNVQGGQRMFITTDGNASIQLYDPSLKPISNVLSAVNPVQISLSQTGNHYIALQGSGPVSLSVYIPPTASSQSVPAPVPAQLKPVQFQAGATSTNFNVNAVNGTPLGYSIQVQAGQKMTVTTTGAATVTLLAPDKATMVPSSNAPVHQWIFPLAQSGNYTLILLGNGPVGVTISIPAASTGNTGGNPIPSTGGTPIPQPANPQRVTFAPGNASTVVNTNLNAGIAQAYVLRALTGQTLYVSTSGPASVTIYGPGGTVRSSGSADFPNRWSTSAGQDGDYTFVITGNGQQALTFYVPPQ